MSTRNTNPRTIQDRHCLDDAKQDGINARLAQKNAPIMGVDVNTKNNNNRTNRRDNSKFDVHTIASWSKLAPGEILTFEYKGKQCVYTPDEELQATKRSLHSVRTNVRRAPLHRSSTCTKGDTCEACDSR